MLITFKTRARYPNITMFGDVAIQLLKLMGRREAVPSAIVPEDIPAALQQLREGLELENTEGSAAATETGEEDAQPVSLHNRAIPLVEILEAALYDDVAVMWEKSGKEI